MELLTYCGLYCGACPSYYRGTCLGCRSEDHSQKRNSKWSCKIRECCIKVKNLFYYGECEDFPCKELNRKLIESHKEDPRFNYRHQIPNNVKKVSKLGIKNWLAEQDDVWTCKECGDTIVFYNYKCMNCGIEKEP